MNIYLLYALLPLIIFPLTGVIMAKVSREIGGIVTSLLRQLWLLVIGAPIIFLIPNFVGNFSLYYKEIFAAWFFGSMYLFTVFKSCDYIEVIQWRVINVCSRVLFSIVIGLLIIGEYLSIWDVGGIAIILLWISLYLYIKNENTLPKYNLTLWVSMSIIWWILFVWSQYYFSVFAKEVHPVTAWYFLEIWSIPFLMILLLSTQWINSFKKLTSLTKQQYIYSFFGSAPVIIGSYWLAVSYTNLDFILVNILFCGTLIMAGVFWYVILWEKLTKLQIVIFTCILIGLFIVNTY